MKIKTLLVLIPAISSRFEYFNCKGVLVRPPGNLENQIF